MFISGRAGGDGVQITQSTHKMWLPGAPVCLLVVKSHLKLSPRLMLRCVLSLTDNRE